MEHINSVIKQIKNNTVSNEIKKTLQDFIKEYPNDKAEAIKQFMIYTNSFGGSLKKG